VPESQKVVFDKDATAFTSFKSNLKAAKLQLLLGFETDQTPGVVVKPYSLPPHPPQTAW
jgi:hypothetical protein